MADTAKLYFLKKITNKFNLKKKPGNGGNPAIFKKNKTITSFVNDLELYLAKLTKEEIRSSSNIKKKMVVGIK